MTEAEIKEIHEIENQINEILFERYDKATTLIALLKLAERATNENCQRINGSLNWEDAIDTTERLRKSRSDLHGMWVEATADMLSTKDE